MARVTGTVTSVEGGIAHVECSPSTESGCATCASGRGCGWQRSQQPRRIQLHRDQGLRRLESGDHLALEVEDGLLLRAACRLYLPPLAGLMAGPALLRVAGMEQGNAPLLAAAAGLALGALAAWRWTRNGVPIRWQSITGPGTPAAPDTEPGPGGTV